MRRAKRNRQRNWGVEGGKPKIRICYMKKESIFNKKVKAKQKYSNVS